MNGLITLKELIGKDFFIPSYQRGYRWEADLEVRQLLEDLYEFFSTKLDASNNFYCLQPLVVKKHNEQYNVLDGQQRLTTFFLIYKVVFQDSIFHLSYETRDDSQNFLQHIENVVEDKKNENIDFFHIYEAFNAIKIWFSSEDSEDKQKLFKDYFLEKSKIIWYEVLDEENEIEVFLRLNIGKIPLTNAELIKALFLSKSDDEEYETLYKRANIWYECEKKTRKENDKAYCLYNNIKKEEIHKGTNGLELSDDITRIEMFFNILSNKVNTKDNPHATFNFYYDELYKQNKSRKQLWKEFEKCQLILLAIANPQTDSQARMLYHYLGFLIATKIYDIGHLRELFITSSSSRTETILKLKKRIKNRFSGINIAELLYTVPTDRRNLEYLLLLFNLEDLSKRIGTHHNFEFNRYKMQDWSLEHIIPQSVEKDSEFSYIGKWLKDLNNFVMHEKVKRHIQKLEKHLSNSKNTNKNDKKLEELVSAIETNIDIYEQDLHTISNLVLLDRNSNSSLSNFNFSEKSKKLEQLSQDRILIPHCTAEAFNKKYTIEKMNARDQVPPNSISQVETNIWTHEDRAFYLEKIEETLSDFLSEGQ